MFVEQTKEIMYQKWNMALLADLIWTCDQHVLLIIINNNNNNNNEFIYTGWYMSVETVLQSSPVMESN